MINDSSINQLHIQPYVGNDQLKKVDILFYHSVNRLKRSYTLGFIYHLSQAIIFIIFIPIDYIILNYPNDSGILAIMILALIASLLQSFSILIYRCVTFNNAKLLLNIAIQLNHVTQQKLNFKDLQNFDNCVSKTMYNQQNQTLISNEGLTQQIKNLYLNYLTSNIKQLITKTNHLLRYYDNFSQFFGFSIMIASIIVLAKNQRNSGQLAVLIIFIITQSLSKLIVITILLLLCISPLICFIMICCVCCCSREQEQLQLPQQQKATEKMITQADGTCSICYQNFMLNDNVIRLKCSPKHMFHPMCISGWAKLKQTCPICRTSMRNPQNQNNQANN